MANGDMELIDLTAEQVTYFDSYEDEAAFMKDWQATKLYREQVFKLKQNDANYRMLSVKYCDVRGYLCLDVCERIGFYLARNSYIMNITLCRCYLNDGHLEKLFSMTLDQRQQNDTIHHIKKHDIFDTILNVASLSENVMDYLAFNPLSKLVHVDLSQNDFGTYGLDLLVKALSGTPLRTLDLSSCGLYDLSPLILGGRQLKQLKQFHLGNNDFQSTEENGIALSVLFDGGYPHLKELYLEECGIDSDLIEIAAPSLSSNHSLSVILLVNNQFGDEGIQELILAICNPQSFGTILASNHTLRKVVVGYRYENSVPESKRKFQRLMHINSLLLWRKGDPAHSKSKRMHYNDEAACRKLFYLLAVEDEDIDPSIVFHYDVCLLPLLFHKLSCMLQNSSHPFGFGVLQELTVIYKVLRCKAFHEKLQIKINHNELRRKEEETRMRNEQLEADNATLLDENRKLKEQIASMMTQNSAGIEIEQNDESIAGRVKRRAKRRKVEGYEWGGWFRYVFS